MINGVHAILFSPEAEAVRAFFRDVLELPSADAGEGWLIFALPPAELAVHPDADARHELYLLCDDLEATMRGLEARGVRFAGPVREQSWGRVAAIAMPDGHELGLYEPRHVRP